MPRQQRGTGVYVNLTARVSQPMMERIEAYLAHVRGEYAAFGLDRSAAVRQLLFKGLEAVGFPVPPEGVDGPSTTGKGQRKDKHIRHVEALYEPWEGPQEDQLPLAKDMTLTPEDLARIPQDPGEDLPAAEEDLERTIRAPGPDDSMREEG